MAKVRVRNYLEALDVSAQRGLRRRGGWRLPSPQVRSLFFAIWPLGHPAAFGCGTADNPTCYCLIQHSELSPAWKVQVD